jgi:PAS domain S-box-containing protein
MKVLNNDNKLEISRELLIKIDDMEIITSISQNCYNILGFTQDEILNTYIDSFLGYSFNELLLQTNVQTSILKKDGQKLLFDIVSNPIINENSKTVGIHLSLINISNYVQINEQYDGFIKVFEKTKDVIFRIEILPKLKFIYVSPSVSYTFGYDVELYHNNPEFVFGIVHPDDAEIQAAKLDKHSDFSKPFCVRFKHKKGHYIWIEDYVLPTFNENGDLVSISGISRDITTRKGLEEKLQEQKKELEKKIITEIKANQIMEKTLKSQEELFINISHEFKTPLNVISATAQLVDMYYKNDLMEEKKDKVIKHINSIKLNCYRLSKLINNIVDTSKIEAKFFELKLSNNNIVEAVEEIVMSVSEFTKIKGLNIIFDTDIEEKIIACDLEAIDRIILNLISNAIKFSNEGGDIFVNIKNIDEWVEISVKDNGIGIKKDHLEIIFDRFKQIDKSLSRNAEGTGIGLALVKSIVELHGGSIDVKSEYGKGSTFIVRIPNRVLTAEQTSFHRNIKNRSENITVEFSDVYL